MSLLCEEETHRWESLQMLPLEDGELCFSLGHWQKKSGIWAEGPLKVK